MSNTPIAALPGLPRETDGPVFREPWEAQAFALVVALQERGVFTAAEWAETLGAQITVAQASGDPDDGTTYYRHWLAALEQLLAAKALVDGATIDRYEHAWHHAAARVPHGQPIVLSESDFG